MKASCLRFPRSRLRGARRRTSRSGSLESAGGTSSRFLRRRPTEPAITRTTHRTRPAAGASAVDKRSPFATCHERAAPPARRELAPARHIHSRSRPATSSLDCFPEARRPRAGHATPAKLKMMSAGSFSGTRSRRSRPASPTTRGRWGGHSSTYPDMSHRLNRGGGRSGIKVTSARVRRSRSPPSSTTRFVARHAEHHRALSTSGRTTPCPRWRRGEQ